MRKLVPLLALVLATTASAQTLDRSFQPLGVYAPAGIQYALQLTDGSRVLAGYIIRGEGQPAGGLFRYTPGGQPDNTFNANAKVSIAQAQFGDFMQLAEAPGGKLLVMFWTSIIRLNADGTRDQGFAAINIGSGAPIELRTMLVQPDGKVVVGGSFTRVAGRPVKRLARFLTDGTEDVAFTTALGTSFDAGSITVLARQTDGKLLVGGTFGSVNGQTRPGLARLDASGAPDNTFAPPFQPAAAVIYLAVQPDGKILASAGGGPGGLLPGSGADFVRLSSSGQPDATFAPAQLPGGGRLGYTGLVGVQADGRIVFQGGTGPNAFVTRLLANGAEDPTWTHPAYNAQYGARSAASVQLLPGGQVLLGGSLPQFGAAPERRADVTLLNADGSYNAAYRPHLLGQGLIDDAVVQPDGSILIAGSFSELNDQPALSLARLLPSGAVDTVFTNRSRLTSRLGIIANAYRLALQPDGKVLVAGTFDRANGQARPGLARLLPAGGLDNSFVPTGTSPTVGRTAVSLTVQPDGRILALGLPGDLLRLQANGTQDPAFAAASPYWPYMPDPLLLPDGSLLVVDNTATVKKLLPTGALDPTFTGMPVSGTPGIFYTSVLTRYPDGRLLAGGYAVPAGGGQGTTAVARFSAAGVPDASFAGLLSPTISPPTQLLRQPDEKILVLTGTAGTNSLLRLLPNGQLDTSFDATQLPGYTKSRLVLQPDGKLLVVGIFERDGYLSIARYTGLVTATKTARTAPQPAAWPNPASGQLHLRPNGPARSLALLDLTGRVVRMQPATAAAEQTLDLRPLPAGVYLLRVEYAQGATATQRVVVE